MAQRAKPAIGGREVMKVVILAGGMGSRISEESVLRPKPMIEIGGKPLLWHIMKLYSAYGLNDFIVCCGYKGFVIKEYFANYFLHMSDVTFELKHSKMHVHQTHSEPWTVALIDTGLHTMTGGRLKRIQPYLEAEDFCLTYGDGLADIDIPALLTFHRAQQSLATVTAVPPPARFGALVMDGAKVTKFREKPQSDGWINGGFFVLSPKVIDYIHSDATVLEQEPMSRLAEEGRLSGYKHQGFWQPMDTLRERNVLEELWNSGRAPWKVW